MNKRSFTQHQDQNSNQHQEQYQYSSTATLTNPSAAVDADADADADSDSTADALTDSIILPIQSKKWNEIKPIEMIKLTAQYLKLKEKGRLYRINHYWNTAINNPLAWIINPYNEWNNCNNSISIDSIHIPYLSSSLQYVSIINLYLYRSEPIIPIQSRCIIYNSMKYLTVLSITTDYNNPLESIDYQLIGSQFSNSLIQLELNNLDIDDDNLLLLANNNLDSLSKLLKLKILILCCYRIELSGLHYFNELTELTNLGLIECRGESIDGHYEHNDNKELLFDNSIIPTMNRLLYLNLYNKDIEFNSFISLCQNNSLSNLLVLKLGNDIPYSAELLLSIQLLINLTILDLTQCYNLNNTILINIGQQCKLIQRLNLSYCDIQEPILSIGEFTNLQRLNLHGNNSAVIDEVLEIISEKLLKLQYLYLGSIDNYTIDGFNYLSILVEDYSLIRIIIDTEDTDHPINDSLLRLILYTVIDNNDQDSDKFIYSWNHIQIPN